MNDLKTHLEAKRLSSSIYMYKQLNIPGVLIECGFLGNSNDRKNLLNNDYHEKIVNSIINSLKRYYN